MVAKVLLPSLLDLLLLKLFILFFLVGYEFLLFVSQTSSIELVSSGGGSSGTTINNINFLLCCDDPRNYFRRIRLASVVSIGIESVDGIYRFRHLGHFQTQDDEERGIEPEAWNFLMK